MMRFWHPSGSAFQVAFGELRSLGSSRGGFEGRHLAGMSFAALGAMGLGDNGDQTALWVGAAVPLQSRQAPSPLPACPGH